MSLLRSLLPKGRKQADKISQDEILQPGTAAPDFTLPTAAGDQVQLSALRGRPVVLAFYPADHTPVCANQLALYNDVLPMFQEHEAALLAISVDDPASHRSFADQLSLRFPLLCDHDERGAAARAYGVFDERSGQARRALFVIDAGGTVRWSQVVPDHVNPGAHGVLHALENLSS